jgi:hypothetical protein
MNWNYHYRDATISEGVESIWTSTPSRRLSLAEMYLYRVQVRHLRGETLWESEVVFTPVADALISGFREGQQQVDRMLVETARKLHWFLHRGSILSNDGASSKHGAVHNAPHPLATI